jgi:ketosteroid isomerase-like protein
MVVGRQRWGRCCPAALSRTTAKDMTRHAHNGVDLVRGIYTAVAQGDIDAVIALLDPAITVVQSSALPFAGGWCGHKGFRAMGAAIYAAWPDFSVTPERFLGDGDTVLVMTRVRAGISSANPLDQPMIER